MEAIPHEIRATYRDLSKGQRKRARQAIQEVLGLHAKIRIGILCRLGGMDVDGGNAWDRFDVAGQDLVALLRLLWSPSGWAPLSLGFHAHGPLLVIARREDAGGVGRRRVCLSDLVQSAPAACLGRDLTAHERVLYSAACLGALRQAAMTLSGRGQVEKAAWRSMRGETPCARGCTSIFWGIAKILRPDEGHWDDGSVHLRFGSARSIVCTPDPLPAFGRPAESPCFSVPGFAPSFPNDGGGPLT